jgi:hypothetical protein
VAPDVTRLLDEVSVGDQRLRRDAAPVEAHAAVFFFLHTRDLEAELPETDGTGVTPGAATEDDGVKRGVHGAAS